MSTPVGHNTLKNMLRDMMAQAQIKGQFTNHSLRVTTATRLFQSGVSEQLVKNQTGHRSCAVQQYKRPSTDQLQLVSNCIQNNNKRKAPPSSEANSSILKLAKSDDDTSKTIVINVEGGNAVFNIHM